MDEKILEVLQQLNSTVQTMGKDLADVKADIKTLQSDMTDVKADIKTLQSDMKGVKADIKVMKADIKTLQSDMIGVKGDIKIMQGDIKAIRAGQEEHSIILGRLEELALVSEAKHDNQMYDHAKLKGRVVIVEDALLQTSAVLAASLTQVR